MSTLIQQLEGRISDWASEESAIRAVLVVGSRARHADHPADEWSDLDLMLFCTDFAP
ncbi:MAG: aminoglycoside 6-adenylyltransferase, partial [Chloroflexi bacterium]|nr:aminoglycoside 6-adenylyltransferase [Chloroflexota bacterium]